MIAASAGDVVQHGRGGIVPRPVRDVRLADDDGTTGHGVLDEAADLVHRAGVGQRAELGVLPVRSTHTDGGDPFAQRRGERVGDSLLDQEPVGADTGLAPQPHLRDHRFTDREVEVGVVEDQERRVAAQLHRSAQHPRTTLQQQ
ncbi:hypothetical protein QBA36_41655 [Streptomyces stelliscabiei]